MNDTLRPNDESHTDIFKNNDIPPRGFISEIVTVITHPHVFFTELGNRQSSPHTLWIVIVILLMMTLMTIQTSTHIVESNSGGASFVDMPGGGSSPFDPGFPPDGGGSDGGTPSTQIDPTAQWMLVLTTISKQLIVWGALTILLTIVTLANGYMPPFGKNLEITIWASVPLALMAGLQLAFMSGGGTITATGFSGFLDEWEIFASLDLRLQSIVHAFSEQMTLFWLWALWLLYVGMRYTLRGKRVVILFTLVMWIIMFWLVNSLHSYDILSSKLPTIEDAMPEEFVPQEFMPEDGIPPMDMPLTYNDQPKMEQAVTDIEGEEMMPIENVAVSPEGA